MTDAPAKDKKRVDYGKAVQNGVLRYVSTSQVKDFDVEEGGCPRQWSYQKVHVLKKPPSKGTDVGKENHEQVEHYLKTGENVLGPIAMAGKRFIYDPGPGIYIEHVFGRLTDPKDLSSPVVSDLLAGDVPVVGSIDLLNVRGTYIDEEGEHRELASDTEEVNDWKFTKNVEKYGKVASALIRTSQMPTYGMLRHRQDPSLARIRLSHTTFQTEGRKFAVKSTTLVPMERIVDRWTKIESVVREMKDVARESDIEKVPANFNACSNYGGCPFKDRCPRPLTNILDDVANATPGTSNYRTHTKEQPMSSLMQRLGLMPVEAPATHPPLAETIVGGVVQPPPVVEKPVEPAPLAAPSGVQSIRAAEARQGHNYAIPFGGKMIEVTYNCRTRGGLSFSRGPGESPITLSDDEKITPLGTVGNLNTILPPDAPLPGVSGPRAEAIPAGTVLPASIAEFLSKHTEEEQKAILAASTVTSEDFDLQAGGRGMSVEEAKAAYTVHNPEVLKTAVFVATTPPNLPDKDAVPVVLTPAVMVVPDAEGNPVVVVVDPVDSAPGAPAEAPKRGRGRPPGSRNKPKEDDAALVAERDALKAEVERLVVEMERLKFVAAGASETTDNNQSFYEAIALREERDALKTEANRLNVIIGNLPPEFEVGRRSLCEIVERQMGEVSSLKAELNEAEKEVDDLRAELAVASPATKAEGISLFIDALPLKGTAESLNPYVEKVCKQIADACKPPVLDLRLAPDLGFGKWKVALATTVRAYPPPPGTYYVLTNRGSSELNAVVADALESVATSVVRGV